MPFSGTLQFQGPPFSGTLCACSKSLMSPWGKSFNVMLPNSDGARKAWDATDIHTTSVPACLLLSKRTELFPGTS